MLTADEQRNGLGEQPERDRFIRVVLGGSLAGMAAASITYPVALGSLPDAAITWQDSAKAVINLTGYTITEVLVGKPGKPATVIKTAGFTVSATAPNLVIAWTPGELASLSPGEWVLQVEATRTSDSKTRHLVVPLVISSKAVI